MKKTILIGYQAVIIMVMVILAGYFLTQRQIGFSVIYVLLAIAGVIALRGEQGQEPGRKAGTK